MLMHRIQIYINVPICISLSLSSRIILFKHVYKMCEMLLQIKQFSSHLSWLQAGSTPSLHLMHRHRHWYTVVCTLASASPYSHLLAVYGRGLVEQPAAKETLIYNIKHEPSEADKLTCCFKLSLPTQLLEISLTAH